MLAYKRSKDGEGCFVPEFSFNFLVTVINFNAAFTRARPLPYIVSSLWMFSYALVIFVYTPRVFKLLALDSADRACWFLYFRELSDNLDAMNELFKEQGTVII